MRIKLYKTLSPDNQLSKVLMTDSEVELEGELARDFDIMSPVFRITASQDMVKECNYLLVPEWERNYFIRYFNQYRNGVLDCYCKEDVLSTYANEIRACQGLFSFGQGANLYRNGAVTSMDVRQRLCRTYTFENPFTNGAFVLVGIKGERKEVPQ